MLLDKMQRTPSVVDGDLQAMWNSIMRRIKAAGCSNEPVLELADEVIDIDLATVDNLCRRAVCEGLADLITRAIQREVDFARGRVR